MRLLIVRNMHIYVYIHTYSSVIHCLSLTVFKLFLKIVENYSREKLLNKSSFSFSHIIHYTSRCGISTSRSQNCFLNKILKWKEYKIRLVWFFFHKWSLPSLPHSFIRPVTPVAWFWLMHMLVLHTFWSKAFLRIF